MANQWTKRDNETKEQFEHRIAQLRKTLSDAARARLKAKADAKNVLPEARPTRSEHEPEKPKAEKRHRGTKRNAERPTERQYGSVTVKVGDSVSKSVRVTRSKKRDEVYVVTVTVERVAPTWVMGEIAHPGSPSKRFPAGKRVIVRAEELEKKSA